MSSASSNASEAFALLVADVFDAAGVLRQYGERIASSAGQTQARWQLLSVVSVGEWTVPMAAERLGTSRQAVQRIANELADDGLVEFVDNPSHRRSVFLQLTKIGRKVLAKITDEAHLRHHTLMPQLATLDLVRLRVGLQDLTIKVRAELDD